MNVCVVANRRWLKRSYSAFVDSCDVVARVNRMENLRSGLTGSRTDCALVSLHDAYWRFSRENRHVDTLRRAGEVWFFPDLPDIARKFADQEGLANWSFLPVATHDRTKGATTCATMVFWMHERFPDARIFFLGDVDAWVRTPSYGGYHACDIENYYLSELVKQGVLVPILEEESKDTDGRFSKVLTIDQLRRQEEELRCLGSEAGREYVLEVSHPYWRDVLIVKGGRAERVMGDDHADVLEFNETVICLRWNLWGSTERFVRTEGMAFSLKSIV